MSRVPRNDSRFWMMVVTEARGRSSVSAARVKLLVSTTRVNTCMAWRRSMANLQEGAGGAQRQSNRHGLARFRRAPNSIVWAYRIVLPDYRHLFRSLPNPQFAPFQFYAYCAVRHECIQTAVLLAVHLCT